MTTGPQRIQRRRSKGWRMPAGAIYVGRPTAVGNPFPVALYGQQAAVDLFRRWLAGELPRRRKLRALDGLRLLALGAIPKLRGHDLVCWCRAGEPCHADVLLELANR